MAHVHGAKTAQAVTEAASAGTAKMMESAMSGMGRMGKGMMDSGMAGMGNMGQGMMAGMMERMSEGMMNSGMGGMAGMGKMGEGMMKSAMGGAAGGVAATAGKSTLNKILTHPVTLIGIGFALGYLVYKCRKDIIPQQTEE